MIVIGCPRCEQDAARFGYTDGISMTTVRGGPERYPPDHQRPCEPWLFVLRDDAENYFVPKPRELGLNGSFAVFKMASTDVVGFENFLQSNKGKIDPELLTAKMCGRQRNGVPLALSPKTDSPPGGISPEQLNNFEYVNADGSCDPKGPRCPVGAHMPAVWVHEANQSPARANQAAPTILIG